MNQPATSFRQRVYPHIKPWLFPLGVLCLYGIASFFNPAGIDRALAISGTMFRQLALPMCFAVVMMVVLNQVVSPAAVARYLGKGAGLKGIFFSGLAGIISMGPIYAWYPLFKTMREKGVTAFIIANFIGCRSIKPVLLPVLIGYFGWKYTVVFVIVSLVGALCTAGIVGVACSAEDAQIISAE